MSLKHSLCISESPKCHLSRVCVFRSPQSVILAEFVYPGVPKVTLKQSLCISESPKCHLSRVCVYQSPQSII